MSSTHGTQPAASRVTEPVPWVDGPVLGFDAETTGVNPMEDRLVTVALVYRGPRQGDGEREQTVTQWLADPGVEIPAAAQAVHGISTAHAREHGRPAAEVLEEVAGQLAGAMRRGVPVVAFNASYDLTLLERELARHGLATLRERLGGRLAPVLDPLVLDRVVDRFRRGKRNLDAMCRVYGVSAQGDMHAADVDVIATLDVLEALVRVYPQIGMEDLARVQELEVSGHRQWARSFNQWLSRQGRTPDADESWPLAAALAR